MRLYPLRRRYGLRWPGKLPRINWRLWVEALAFVALLQLYYALTDYISRSAILNDKASLAERQRIKSENALAHCLNGGSLREDHGMVMCEKALWVQM